MRFASSRPHSCLELSASAGSVVVGILGGVDSDLVGVFGVTGTPIAFECPLTQKPLTCSDCSDVRFLPLVTIRELQTPDCSFVARQDRPGRSAGG